MRTIHFSCNIEFIFSHLSCMLPTHASLRACLPGTRSRGPTTSFYVVWQSRFKYKQAVSKIIAQSHLGKVGTYRLFFAKISLKWFKLIELRVCKNNW